MADPVVVDSAAIWLGGYDITGSLNEIHFTLGRGENKDSRFGDTLDCAFPGPLQAMIEAAGFDDSTTSAAVQPRLQSDRTSWPITIAPPYAPSATAGADGNIAYTLLGSQCSYETGGKFGESAPYKFKTMPRTLGTGGAISRQTVMLPKASVTATTTGTARQLGALSATQFLVAVLHVFTVTGGTWTVTVQSDDNSGMTTPVTRATFTAATAVTRQAIVVAGAVADDWWQVVLTKSGGTNCTAAVLLGIV